MNTKKPTLFIALLGISLFSAVVFTNCTDDGAKKEAEKTEVAPATPDTSKMTAAPAMADSPKMAEPAKADSPAKPASPALKKVDQKPLGTKP